jgi:hypothetical protein
MQARVVIAQADEVDVQYLDADDARIYKLSRAQMLSEPRRYRLDKDAK